MAILKIARMGHPVLARVADPVADPRAPEIRVLAADMMETMVDADGAGLAAPQVHVSKRVVVFQVPAERLDAENGAQGGEPAGVPFTVMINPEIEPLDDEREDGWEGCLSVPGLTGKVPRWRRIRYSWTGLDGERHSRDAEGFHARVVQHECDHLDGVLYPARMEDMGQFGFVEEIRRTRLAAARQAMHEQAQEQEDQ